MQPYNAQLYNAQSDYDADYPRRQHYPQQTSLCCPVGNGFSDTFSKIGPYYCLFVGTIVFLAIVGLLLDEIGKDA